MRIFLLQCGWSFEDIDNLPVKYVSELRRYREMGLIGVTKEHSFQYQMMEYLHILATKEQEVHKRPKFPEPHNMFPAVFEKPQKRPTSRSTQSAMIAKIRASRVSGDVKNEGLDEWLERTKPSSTTD